MSSGVSFVGAFRVQEAMKEPPQLLGIKRLQPRRFAELQSRKGRFTLSLVG
jgi:hypothetical protein